MSSMQVHLECGLPGEYNPEFNLPLYTLYSSCKEE